MQRFKEGKETTGELTRYNRRDDRCTNLPLGLHNSKLTSDGHIVLEARLGESTDLDTLPEQETVRAAAKVELQRLAFDKQGERNDFLMRRLTMPS